MTYRVKFPFDIKYCDEVNEEVVFITLSPQGNEMEEKQLFNIAEMLMRKNKIETVVFYNPHKWDIERLRKHIEFFKIEEIKEY